MADFGCKFAAQYTVLGSYDFRQHRRPAVQRISFMASIGHVTVAELSPAAERGELTNLGNRFARISTRSCLRAVRASVTRAEISQRRESDRYCWTSYAGGWCRSLYATSWLEAARGERTGLARN